MSKKYFCFIGLFLAACLILSFFNQNHSEKYNPDNDTTEILATITELPEVISKNSLSVISLPGWQQCHYQSVDQKKRIVLEIRLQTSSPEDLSDKDAFALHKPTQEESVYEWEQSHMKCRLFGSFSENTLKKISNSVQVHAYE